MLANYKPPYLTQQTTLERQFQGVQVLWMQGTPILLLRDQASVKDFYQDQKDHGKDFRSLGYMWHRLMGRSLGVQVQDDWTRLRNLFGRHFNASALSGQHAMVCRIAHAWLDRLHPCDSIALRDTGLEQAVIGMLAELVYGTLSSDDLQQLEQMYAAHKRVLAHMSLPQTRVPGYRYLRTSVNDDFCNFERDWLEFNNRMWQQRAAKDNNCSGVMAEAVRNDQQHCSKDELFQTLYELLLFNVDITFAAIAYLVRNVAAHPHVASEIRAELAKAKSAGHSGRDADADDLLKTLVKLPYINATLLESARVNPALLLTFPETTNPHRTTQVAGYSVPPGTLVVVDAHTLNNDPSVWPDSAAFQPERHLSTSTTTTTTNHSPPVMHQFGLGVRRCLGARFAQHFLKVVLIGLLERFQLTLPADDTNGSDNNNSSVVRSALPYVSDPGSLRVRLQRTQ